MITSALIAFGTVILFCYAAGVDPHTLSPFEKVVLGMCCLMYTNVLYNGSLTKTRRAK